MKKAILVLLHFLFFLSSHAQDAANRFMFMPLNTIDLKVFGPYSISSINYERLFPIGTRAFFSGELGVGFLFLSNECKGDNCPKRIQLNSFPHQITYNWGGGRNFLELGLGGSYASGELEKNYLMYALFGYRFQPMYSSKLSFRLFCWIPFNYLPNQNLQYIPLGGSLGAAF